MMHLAWPSPVHEHCQCGCPLAEQMFENTEPACFDCGYFSHECRCNLTPCHECGKELER
jgi:hypothetical protein